MKTAIAMQLDDLLNASLDKIRVRIKALGLTEEQVSEMELLVAATACIAHLTLGLTDMDSIIEDLKEEFNV